MIFRSEMFALLIRFTKDIDGKDITTQDLINLPYWRCVWGWWKALAYYKMNNHYERLEDVPERLEHFIIMDEVNTTYYRWDNEEKTQVITKESCKKFYGD